MSPFRRDAKERSGGELLRGVQVLQTGDNQESHRASFHDRTPQGERISSDTNTRAYIHFRANKTFS